MKVTLLTQTENMIEILWTIWQLSRSQESSDAILEKKPSNSEYEEFFRRIINEAIPLAEMIDFIFVLDDIPISLREQLVRHRIGVKVAGQEFCDVVPDLADSSFWSQSMRVLDMGDFEFFIPESIKKGYAESESRNTLSIYNGVMKEITKGYKRLVRAGVPHEDARNVIPLGATHRIIWKLNLAAIKHILSKRSCWILQLGLWKPVIQGMVSELCEIDPAFKQLATPPCMEGDDFKACLFCENNFARIKGDVDPLPPCPLFLNYYKDAAQCVRKVFPKSKTCWYWQSDIKRWLCSDVDRMFPMGEMKIEYTKFWNRNIHTGAIL